jgi:hypothetical protein
LQIQLGEPGFYGGKIEHVVDQLLKVLAAAPHHSQVLLAVFSQWAIDLAE